MTSTVVNYRAALNIVHISKTDRCSFLWLIKAATNAPRINLIGNVRCLKNKHFSNKRLRSGYYFFISIKKLCYQKFTKYFYNLTKKLASYFELSRTTHKWKYKRNNCLIKLNIRMSIKMAMVLFLNLCIKFLWKFDSRSNNLQ